MIPVARTVNKYPPIGTSRARLHTPALVFGERTIGANGRADDVTEMMPPLSLRANARHVYEVVDDNTYNMKIQFSPDAEGWADVLTGVYRRAS